MKFGIEFCREELSLELGLIQWPRAGQGHQLVCVQFECLFYFKNLYLHLILQVWKLKLSHSYVILFLINCLEQQWLLLSLIYLYKFFSNVDETNFTIDLIFFMLLPATVVLFILIGSSDTDMLYIDRVPYFH